MVSLALRKLLRERTRLAISVGGIAFAVTLIVLVRGLFVAYQTRVADYFDGVETDAWVLQSATADFFHSFSLLPTALRAGLADIQGVDRTTPYVARLGALEVDRTDTGAALTLSACTTDSPKRRPAPPTTTSRSVPELEDAVSNLTLNLWAEPTAAEITPGVTTDVYSFGAEVIDGDPASITPSDSYLGPTLRMRTGQRVRITFENRLPEESIVHRHGPVVLQDQDGQPSDAVAPGATYEYDVVIDNPPGTYWYHPHADRQHDRHCATGIRPRRRQDTPKILRGI